MNWRNRKPKYAEFAVGMGMGLCLWLCESWETGLCVRLPHTAVLSILHVSLKCIPCFQETVHKEVALKRVFSPNRAFFLRTWPARLAPYELAHVPCSGITRRLCGWGGSGTQDSRAPRLWQSSRQSGAYCRVELHDCCALLQGVACRGAPPSTY